MNSEDKEGVRKQLLEFAEERRSDLNTALWIDEEDQENTIKAWDYWIKRLKR